MTDQSFRLIPVPTSRRSLAASTPPYHLEKYTERDNKNRLKRKRCSECYSGITKSRTEKKLAEQPKRCRHIAKSAKVNLHSASTALQAIISCKVYLTEVIPSICSQYAALHQKYCVTHQWVTQHSTC